MVVERTDFITVPVTEVERSTRFYRETVGVQRVGSQLMLHRRGALRG